MQSVFEKSKPYTLGGRDDAGQQYTQKKMAVLVDHEAIL